VTHEMAKYFDAYYSANIMKLVVLGPQSLDELQKAVESRFSVIPNKKVELPFWKDNPYNENTTHKWVGLVPQTDIRYLYLTFPVQYHFPSAKFNTHVNDMR